MIGGELYFVFFYIQNVKQGEGYVRHDTGPPLSALTPDFGNIVLAWPGVLNEVLSINTILY